MGGEAIENEAPARNSIPPSNINKNDKKFNDGGLGLA